MIYYLYCSFPKKIRNPSFQKFKLQHLPFYWDKISHDEEEKDEVLSNPENVISQDEWMDRIKNLSNSKTADISDLERMNLT